MGDKPAEHTIFRDDGITITSARAQLGPTTYPIAAISSVGLAAILPKRGNAILATLVGVFMAYVSIFTGTVTPAFGPGAVVGVPLIAVGLWLALRQKTRYVVRLRTAGGEVDAWESLEYAEVKRISDALNEAVVRRAA